MFLQWAADILLSIWKSQSLEKLTMMHLSAMFKEKLELSSLEARSSETVIGGGFAETSNAEMASKALVDGDTYVLVAGGSIKDVVGGGLASGPTAVADVSGDSNIVIAGGSISGNIYAGGVVQNGTEAASAKVQGNAKVTFPVRYRI